MTSKHAASPAQQKGAIAESWEGSEDVSNGRETVPLLQQTHPHSSQMQHLGVLMNTGPFLKLFPKKDWLGQVEQVVGGYCCAYLSLLCFPPDIQLCFKG